jgi:ketosteroid isomerase-like protein
MAVVACSFERPAAQEKAEDAIRETLQAYATAWNGADARTISNLFTVDADYAGFGSVMTRGRDEIAQRYEALFTGAYSGSHLEVAMSSPKCGPTAFHAVRRRARVIL